jgi:hypothetical protein
MAAHYDNLSTDGVTMLVNRLLTDEEVAAGVLELISAGKSKDVPNGSAMRVYVAKGGECKRTLYEYPKAFGGTA